MQIVSVQQQCAGLAMICNAGILLLGRLEGSCAVCVQKQTSHYILCAVEQGEAYNLSAALQMSCTSNPSRNCTARFR